MNLKHTRNVFALSLALGLLLALSALGGVGFAKNTPAAQSQYEKKVTVCHKGKVTIRVGRPALKAHLAHGDSQGTCAAARSASAAKGKGKAKKQAQPAPTATTPTATSSSGHGKGKKQEQPAPTAAAPSDHGNGHGKGKK